MLPDPVVPTSVVDDVDLEMLSGREVAALAEMHKRQAESLQVAAKAATKTADTISKYLALRHPAEYRARGGRTWMDARIRKTSNVAVIGLRPLGTQAHRRPCDLP